MERCPQCGGAITPAKKHQTEIVDGTTFIVKLPAFACRECRGVFMEGHALERVDLEIACVLATRASASGAGFRFLRKALGMRAHDLAELLNVTAETISRWENDQRAVDGNAWIVVGSIVLEKANRPPTTLKRALGLIKGPSLGKTVRIDVTSSNGGAASTSGPSSTRVRRATGS